MIEEITHICRDMKKRVPGSEGEREAGEYMAGVLKKECGCTDVKVEPFTEHPAAFYGYFWFSAAFDCLCAVSFFFRSWLSIVFGAAALLLFLFQFVLYKQIIDPLFPKKEIIAAISWNYYILHFTLSLHFLSKGSLNVAKRL